MPKTIADLWYGNLIPCDRTLKKDSHMAGLVAQIAETQEDLFARLNDEEKALFEQFADDTAEMYGLSEWDAFISGFTLGARIIIEVMRARSTNK